MTVVILCGGLGTRLREETEFRPKPMVKIGNRPVLWHIMKIYAHFGFENFVLSVGYKGEMIKEYFLNYDVLNNNFTVEFGSSNSIEIHDKHDEMGWRVTVVDTGENTLKGARLKRVEQFIATDDFMVTYGDGVANVNIRELWDYHLNHKRIATVTGVNITSRFGKLSIENDEVVKFSEKPNTANEYVNGGFFVFNKKIFKHLSKSESCDLEVGSLEKLALEKELMVYKHKGFWACMDTQRDVEHLNKLWKENRAEWKVW